MRATWSLNSSAVRRQTPEAAAPARVLCATILERARSAKLAHWCRDMVRNACGVLNVPTSNDDSLAVQRRTGQACMQGANSASHSDTYGRAMQAKRQSDVESKNVNQR